MSTKLQSDQLKHEAALSSLGKAAGSTLESILTSIEASANSPMRASAAATPDAKLYLTANKVERGDGVGLSTPPTKSNIPSVVASTINFQTQAVTGATFDITWPTSTVGQFRRLGLTLLSSGTIKGIFSAEAASVGALANPGGLFVKTGTPICYIDLECTNVAGQFKTAGSATNIIENKVSGTSRIVMFGSGGGSSGSGTGSGVADDLASLTFKASVTDDFSNAPDLAATSTVANIAGYTDASLYDVVNEYFRLAYDATKTVTGTGTAMTISSAPSFTIKAGDIIRVGSEVRRITAISSQTSVTIDLAFTTNPSSAACTVAQCVHTYPVNGMAFDGVGAATAFPSDNVTEALIDYEDTSAANDIIFDVNSAPVIAYTVSGDNSTAFSNVKVRNTTVGEEMQIVPVTTGGNLYIRFFPNATSGSGSANILKYRAFFFRDNASVDGSIVNQAYCFTDGVGTEINCAAPSVVSGKTRVVATWASSVGVNSGTTNGSKKVYLNGQKIPRYVDATITPDASYKEIDEYTIELDTDYSAQNYSLEIIQDVSIVDSTDSNSTNIAYMQEIQSNGFQSFIDQSSVLNATTTTGSPVAGAFYSTVSGRKSIIDLAKDLKPRMGIERIQTQKIFQLQDEFGPNGEPVFGVVNDILNQIRFIGSNWSQSVDSNGQLIIATSGTSGDYVEVTFYGTGLNMMYMATSFTTYDLRASVDGGAEGSNIIGASASTILQARNYAANQVINVVSGLTLGLHTVKIRNVTLTGTNHRLFGFEILNESSSVKVQPGSSYVGGKKLTSSIQNVLAYNSTFESGTLGTRGGRVLVYQKADGTVKKAVTPTNAAAAYLTSADHTNEEIARTYHWREFGSNRADDFSTLTATASSRAFTLDDGAITLVGQNARDGADGSVYSNATSDFFTFTFVGTGLDIILSPNAGGGGSIYIDGTLVAGTGNTAWAANKSSIKVASGLPYGTHTVRLVREVLPALLFPKQFIVYQPKTPSLPSGAVTLGAFNVMATYAANSTAGVDTIATGVLRKMNMREFIFVNGTGGTTDWSTALNAGSVMSGAYTVTDRSAAYVEYVFFGIGLEARFQASSTGSANISVSLQSLSTGGSLLAATTGNFASLVSSVYGTGVTFSAGVLDQNDGASTNGCGLSLRGLTLGLWKVRLTNNTASSYLRIDALDIITPIHSHKSNLTYDQQNTLLVGSQSIADARALSPIKDSHLQKKNISQSVGVQSGPSTSSTSLVPMPDMSVTHNNTSGKIKISYSANVNQVTSGNGYNTAIFLDGVQVGSTKQSSGGAANLNIAVSDVIQVDVAPGFHKVDVCWNSPNGTSTTASGTNRNLLVEEV